MINELKTTANFEKYVERMASVRDKSDLTSMISPHSRVLDYGCGSGIMAEYFDPNEYVGYDISAQMVARAQTDHPNHTFTDSLMNNGTFDVIMFSSILHEVYSYNNNSYDEVINSLIEVKSILNDNGIIVIRDGIMPIGDDYHESIIVKDAEDARKFLNYLREGPQDFSDIHFNNNVLSGSMKNIVNFLNVYTWGWKSVERERMERVNFATHEQWKNIFKGAGLKTAETHIIKQDSYFENLNKIADLHGMTWETKAYFKLIAV